MLCFMCKRVFENLKILFLHFKRVHNLSSDSVIRCCETDCNQAFQNLGSLKKHFNRKHLIENNIIENIANVDKIPSDSKVDDSSSTLLKSWNQQHLIDHFLAQNITLEVLKVIKRHHIQSLLKNFDMGTLIMFEHNLEVWRNSEGIPLSEILTANSFKESPASPATSRTSRVSTLSRHSSSPYERSNSPDDNYISLHIILNESPKGLAMCEYYVKNGKLHDEQRNLLVSLIVGFYEDKLIHLSLATSYKLEKEILERFPTERLEYYRTGKRGKIYNRCSNLKSSLKAALPCEKRISKDKKTTSSRIEKEFLPEEDTENCLRCLKYDNLSQEEFDNCWKACVIYRISQIKASETTAVILSIWPFYKAPSGYRLIDYDFKYCFDKDRFIGLGLIDGWELYCEGLLSFLIQHIKDKALRVTLKTLTETTNITESSKNATILWCLHGYLFPTSLTMTKKENKRSSTRYTIRDSQESFLYVGNSFQQIENHITFLKTSKKAIQPFIYAVGPDLLHIQDIGVYFDDIHFKFQNFIRAVDICFKIIYLFNLSFSPESKTFYTFLEYFFYELKSESVTSKIHILAEYLKSNKE